MKSIFTIAMVMLFIASASAQVTQINNNDDLEPIAYLNGSKIFLTDKNGHLWISDATLAGTVRLSSTIKVEKDGILFNGKLIFVGSTPATGIELYESDGTPGGTRLLVDIVPGAESSDPGYDLIPMNGYLYFNAETATYGRELWRTNGTTGNAAMVKDIWTGSDSGIPESTLDFEVISMGSYLLFSAIESAATGIELWRSDGTGAGTFLVKDIEPGTGNSTPEYFHPYQNGVLFFARTAAGGREIWKSNGTAAGTTMLRDILPGPSSSTEYNYVGFPITISFGFHEFHGELFFRVFDGTHFTLYKTNGTTTGTVAVKQLAPASFAWVSDIFDYWNLSNRFVFCLGDAQTRSELWESDGTAAGTRLVFSFPSVEETVPFIFPNYYYSVNSGGISYQLYKGSFFMSGTDATGVELWKSDGTAAGTVKIKDINPAGNGLDQNLAFLYTSAGLYFAADDGTSGNELWLSDGTAGGTNLVKDINPAGDAEPELGLFVGKSIVFTATDGDDETYRDLFIVGGNFTPLPLRLLLFNAVEDKGRVAVSWSTEQEFQTKDFLIEVSKDLSLWSRVAEVPAAGISPKRKDYLYADEQAPVRGAGTLFYRLQMRDLDGRIAYSDIAAVNLRKHQWDAHLLDNPVRGEIKMRLSGTSGPSSVSVIDFSGKVLWKGSVEPGTGDKVSIPVNLPNGIFILRVEHGGSQKHFRIVNH